MIIRTQIKCKIVEDNKWSIIFYDENGLISICTIPPTNGNRTDIILSTKTETGDGVCYTNKYLYSYKGNLRKLKGEKIIISIESGKVGLKYKMK